MPEATTDDLARLVRQKRQLLERLVQMGRGQGELVEAGRTQELLKLLAEKQRFIDGLRSVEGSLAAFREQDPDQRLWPSPKHRADCQADSDACNRLLAELLETEERHEQLMATRRDAVNDQLRQAQHAHAAATAYKPHLRPVGDRPPAAMPPTAAPIAALDLSTAD